MSRAKSKKTEVSTDEVKYCLLKSARTLFAKLGFQGANLKDIASDAGVANSLINYYYQDKDGLFKACLETFAKNQFEVVNRVMSVDPQSREEMLVRLELFVNEMFISSLNDPEGFEIVQREVISGNKMVLKIFEETFLAGFKNVTHFFKKAQDNGLIKEGLDPFLLATLLFTTTCETARKDRLGKQFFNVSLADANWRKKVVHHIVTLFANGVIQ